MDKKIIVIIFLLIVIGCIALWSATNQIDGINELKKQILWAVVGFAVMIGVSFINYETYERFWPVLYGISIILLIGVLFTPAINGAHSWYNLGFMNFQPSELAKIFVIISLSSLITKITKNDEEGINKLKNLVFVFLLMVPPIVLIILQPDYGTAMAFIVFTAIMLFISNFKRRYILIAILLVCILLPLLYLFILPAHAKARIDVFLNPELDPLGSGYNVIQSKLAIGSGKLFGMGLLKGNQTQMGYLYPKTTDFIYAVISEEMGFVVAALVIILSMWLLLRCLHISRTAKDKLGSLIAIGFFGMFMFYITENIGMTMGLLPITGVPLPFVSYGGSSMITNMISIGILLNISGQRQKIMILG